MFRPKNLHEIVTYLLLFVLSLSSHSLASVKTVQNWGDDGDVIYYFTTRRPYKFDKHPTSMSTGDSGDRTVFFVVLTIGIFVIGILVFYCYRHYSSDSDTTHGTTAGATVHQPPPATRFNRPQTTTRLTNFRFADEGGVSVSFTNSTYTGARYSSSSATDQVDSASDKPPDYATVTINDLGGGSRTSSFPPVRNPEDAPPPKYEAGL